MKSGGALNSRCCIVRFYYYCHCVLLLHAAIYAVEGRLQLQEMSLIPSSDTWLRPFACAVERVLSFIIEEALWTSKSSHMLLF